MTVNQATWITASKSYPFVLGPAPYSEPGPGEVVIKTQASALNPVEWRVQTRDMFKNSYPFILGADAAGCVDQVGENVTHVQVGQRVMGYCMGLGIDKPAFGAYQKLPTVFASLVAPIPDDVSFEQAVPVSVNKSIPIWGGSSSVGAIAIQLAVASGLDVVSTASAHSHDLVKSLGAHLVFDHKSPSIVEDLVAEFSRREIAAVFDSISEPETMGPISAVVERTGPLKVGVVAPPTIPLSKNFLVSMSLAFELFNGRGKGVLDAVWGTWVPEAMDSDYLQFRPEPVVVGQGLGSIQDGSDRLKRGVSAQKLIVRV
ncbi:TOXD [Verticillium alfalfae VaMs.102]|uniref:TOXD n=1 Tax=Verticillium alfalfae (strain VaMs.102 / ATCC MYA-4576 / FGSC 10136) TaxID=526221 RepID=C9S6S1_VERA1|nr:TOXD [Verticillium alfalfae VaMs.102]EEY15174.1 TOXD [Verticillium alfalfae VaMs.102]